MDNLESWKSKYKEINYRKKNFVQILESYDSDRDEGLDSAFKDFWIQINHHTMEYQ